MNIEEYRAMVTQEKEQAEQPPVEETPPVVEETPTTEPLVVETPETTQVTPTETTTPEPTIETTPEPTPINEIEIDGRKFTIDQIKEITKRQDDSIMLEKQLAREKKELEDARQLQEFIYSNPQLAMELKQKGLPILDPQEKQMKDLNQKYQDLLLDREINELKSKYDDFDPRTVLQYAYDNKLTNIEDAYHLVKLRNTQANTPVIVPNNEPVSTPSIDVEALKEQIRQDVLKELQSSVDTGSLMTSNSTSIPVEDNTIRLSASEIRIAKNLRMSPEEYVKWKSKK